MVDKKAFKIAVPSKGRLKEQSEAVLRDAGLQFRTPDRHLFATCRRTGVMVVYTHAIDVPVLVHEGVVDLGITGSDLVQERNARVHEHQRLGFGGCRLCLAVQESRKIRRPEQLTGAVIGTKFMNLAKRFFAKHKTRVHLVKIEGATEGMVGLGMVDGIVELVASGDSLRANQLKEIHEIGRYEAVLIGSRAKTNATLRKRLLRRIEGVMLARRYSLMEYNIPRKQMKKAIAITPGYNSPTVQELADAKWVAVKVMVPKNDVQDVMDRLERIGAEAVFEMEVNHCRL